MQRHDTADRDEIKGMLRQLLADQQKEPDKAVGKGKDGKESKEVMEDNALAKKEGFGDDKAKSKLARRTSASSGSSGSSCSSSDSDDDEVEAFPNPWARFRHAMREPFAEFLGTCTSNAAQNCRLERK